jgi:hypothetical protein
MTDRFVLVQRDGTDTLHRNPREECNVDDAKAKSTIDEATALGLFRDPATKRCQHCNTEEGHI